MKLKFNSRDPYYKQPFGAVAAETAIAFRVAASSSGEVPIAVQLLIRRDEDAEGNYLVEGVLQDAGTGAGTGEGAEVSYTFSFSWEPKLPGLYFYHFLGQSEDSDSHKTEEYALTVYEKEFQTPEWLSGGLMYQIFPDRFARSSSYDPPKQNKAYRMHEQWGEPPDSGPDENGVVWNRDFFGGNLRGIEEQLPYLAELGVTVIYLNPIFRAFSNHRYDTANYMEIDPMLGAELDFVRLCRAARERGIRILLDGVFNHTGSHSLYFNKDGAFDTIGACQSTESAWYSWYSFQDYPERYDSWWGIDTLPAVNEMEESYRDYIIRSEDSVIKHWLRLGASGLRLDVADELPDLFLEEVRQAVKGVCQDGALIGEVWEDASTKIAYGHRRRYFQGRQLDSVMNYPLKDWLIDFLNNHRDGRRLQDQILSLAENYPLPCWNSLMNILGTHDTERILTVLSAGTESYEEARQRLFFALLVWAFMPGIPCLYYGDELGMEGGRDPFNRCCFEREKARTDVEGFYRRLLYFRKNIRGLGGMAYEPGECGEGYFSFRRTGAAESVWVFLNLCSETKRVSAERWEGEQLLDFVNCGQVAPDGEGGFLLFPGAGIVLQAVK